MNVLLIDCEDSYTLNIYEYLRRLDISVKLISYHNFSTEMGLESFDAVILSPGPNEASSYPKLLDWLEINEHNIPILGICLGHQIIGHFYGHKSIHAQKPLHGVPFKISCSNHPIFQFLGTDEMTVMPYHSLVIDQNSMSPLKILAKNTNDEIMAFVHKDLPIAGFQFHPESIGTPRGLELLKAWKEWVENNNF